jgi:hypothetical protein
MDRAPATLRRRREGRVSDSACSGSEFFVRFGSWILRALIRKRRVGTRFLFGELVYATQLIFCTLPVSSLPSQATAGGSTTTI